MAINYYFSGEGTANHLRKSLAEFIPFRLLSCHENFRRFGYSWADNVLLSSKSKDHNTLLLDSGAFTGWNKGHEVTLDDLLPVYNDFMWKYWESCKEIYLINLDKIPGSPGRTPDEAEIQECIEISDKNYEILVKEFGHRVLPVFHQGESETRLLEVEKMSNYICVSPRNDLHENQRVSWSKEVHSKISRSTKTHGLAATGMEMMTTVPWTSVDSATWMFLASTGNINLCINGKLLNIGVSDRSPTRFIQGQHINNSNPEVKKLLLNYIEDRGYNIEALISSYDARTDAIIREIQYWVDNHHYLEFNEVNTLFPL